MRDHDEDGPEFDGPSRSQERREALAVLELAKQLVELSEPQLAQVPMDDDLRAVVHDTRRITQQIARKRQTQYLAKQLRRRSDEELATLRAALHHDREVTRRDTAELHRIEAWRDRLIDEGDEALSQLLQQFPQADRQHLRGLARQAKVDRLANKPPHSYRELFRALRETMGIAEE